MSQRKEITVSFDDIPKEIASEESSETLYKSAEKIISHFCREKIPVSGFINEKAIYQFPMFEDGIKLLKLWLNSGIEPGNHTYSHYSLNNTDINIFTKDIKKGELLSAKILKKSGSKIKYFRYPFNATGENMEKKLAAENVLKELGYIIAPITIDTLDYLYQELYSERKKKQDYEALKKIKELYFDNLKKLFRFYEKISEEVMGYQIKQILLLHPSEMISDFFTDITEYIQNNNYQFISLETALEDPAYQLSDLYAGDNGISWLLRWTYSKGMIEQFNRHLQDLFATINSINADLEKI